MQAALGTGAVGLGVTFTSTFASSLGLSMHQQRIGFAFGVLLIVTGAVLFFRARKAERDEKDSHEPAGSAFARTSDQSKVISRDNYSEADTFFETSGESVVDSEDDVHRPHGEEKDTE